MSEKRFELFNEDCLRVLPTLSNIDLILTHPPYLMDYRSRWMKYKDHRFRKPILNDNNVDLIKKVIPLLFDCLKDGGGCYMFCNSNHIDVFKSIFDKYFNFKNVLIWIKNDHTAGDLQGAYGKKTEFILFGSKGRHLLNGKRDVDTLFYDRVSSKNRLHQNQKPIDLLEFLINKSSKENDIVLDCFMGSGSTGVACFNTNRRFIGVELDKDYYNIAEQRINQVNEQRRLV